MTEPNKKTAGLPETGWVRKPQFLGPGKPIPISNSKWYKGIREGEYPAPIKLAPNISVWRVEDIRALIDRLSGKAAANASK